MDLGEGLRKAIAKLRGATIIDAKTIKEFNKELQKALISSDVDVGLVFDLTKRIEKAALHSNLPSGVSSRDYIINMLYEELSSMMGSSYSPKMEPKRVLLLGLYGSGKTTTAAKLAKYYQDRGLSSALICCDTTRPAAYEQLEILAKQANVSFFGIKDEKDVKKIIKDGLLALKGKKVIICDSGGRNALDNELTHELKSIVSEFKPDEKLLVLNADIGQVAHKQATEFDNAIKINGVIVSKLDGSGRGGGALSAVNAAHVNITFVGTGEKLNAIELYDSKKFVGRLLGMPDLETLVERVSQAVNEAGISASDVNANELSIDAFYAQLKTMSNVGPMKNIMGMLGISDMPKEMMEQSEEKLAKYKVIIGSMTKEERKNDSLLHNQSRIKRISAGSGTSEKDVRDLLSDFNKMKKMMSKVQNDRDFRRKLSKMIPGFGQ
jgi:signal recognition particle subunit SRP54